MLPFKQAALQELDQFEFVDSRCLQGFGTCSDVFQTEDSSTGGVAAIAATEQSPVPGPGVVHGCPCTVVVSQTAGRLAASLLPQHAESAT